MYLYLQRNTPTAQSQTEYTLALISGCDSTCSACTQLTGNAIINLQTTDTSFRTNSKGVYKILYNNGSGNVDATQSVDTLTTSNNLVESGRVVNQPVFIVILIVVGMLLSMCIASQILSCLLQCLVLGGPVNAVAPADATIIGGQEPHTREEIERVFPCKNVEDSPLCVVCLQDVLSTEQARELQCNHFFHAECIMEWWLHTPRSVLECPVCRQAQDLKHSPGRNQRAVGVEGVADVQDDAAQLPRSTGLEIR